MTDQERATLKDLLEAAKMLEHELFLKHREARECCCCECEARLKLKAAVRKAESEK